MTTEPTLDSILSGDAARAAEPAIQVDEREELITDPVKNEIGTDQVDGASPDDEPSTEAKGAPNGAFKAEREKVSKRYTEEVADLRKTIVDQEARTQQRFEEMLARLTAPPKPAAEAPDFFADPQAAVRAELQPFVQAQQAQAERMSAVMAVDKHGEETVQQAFQWLEARKAANPGAFQAEYGRIMSSPHPYGELVKVFKQSQVLSEIGDDPAAYREKLRAELLAELNSSGETRPPAGPRTNGAAAALAERFPSDFAAARNAGTRGSGDTWQGPPPLRSIFKS